jgi:hypothetical protein
MSELDSNLQDHAESTCFPLRPYTFISISQRQSKLTAVCGTVDPTSHY